MSAGDMLLCSRRHMYWHALAIDCDAVIAAHKAGGPVGIGA